MIVSAWNLTQKIISEMKSLYDEVAVHDGTMEITHSELDFKEVVDRLHAGGATIRSAYVKEPSLDDVFLSITGKEIRE
jgi:ABC-2 type transport system ATP-binding protein